MTKRELIEALEALECSDDTELVEFNLGGFNKIQGTFVLRKVAIDKHPIFAGYDYVSERGRPVSELVQVIQWRN